MVVRAQRLQVLGTVVVAGLDVVDLVRMVATHPAALAPSAPVLVALQDERA
ncbi:hypothetical protein AB4225_06145 [Streptomyces sp. 2RAF24]|uniref:hypothetical protein n=1 Tax=Streptomyces sp. 2RAF24 TaxID=3232997 RepID=UPI003F947AD7